MSVFSKEYWICATRELKNVRMLVLAAFMIAARVAVRSVSIPIVPGVLYINFGFLINALGAMTFGPVVAILAACVSDTLGAMLFPQGVYFFPYIFQEIAGSLIFALFLYRRNITVARISLSRFSVSVICNLILYPIITAMWNYFYPDSAYALITELRIVKNIALFPWESVLLVIFLGAMMPVMKSLKLIPKGEKSADGTPNGDGNKLKIKIKDIILLVIITVVFAFLYCLYRETSKTRFNSVIFICKRS